MLGAGVGAVGEVVMPFGRPFGGIGWSSASVQAW